MSLLGKIAKVCKVIVKSPVTKTVAGGVAVAFPAVGVPALAGLAAADKVVDAADQGQHLIKQVRTAASSPSPVPGGPSPYAAALAQRTSVAGPIKMGLAASQIVKNTAAAAKTDPNAARALKTMQLVRRAKQGQPAAVAALHREVRTQIAGVLAAGMKPGASPQDVKVAKAVKAIIVSTAARKKASRKFGVDRRTARVVRVA